jgi:hypothetical protein
MGVLLKSVLVERLAYLTKLLNKKPPLDLQQGGQNATMTGKKDSPRRRRS